MVSASPVLNPTSVGSTDFCCYSRRCNPTGSPEHYPPWLFAPFGLGLDGSAASVLAVLKSVCLAEDEDGRAELWLYSRAMNAVLV